MNKKQRAVLIIGAVIFVFVVLQAPRYVYVHNVRMPAEMVPSFFSQIDLGTAATRGFSVLGGTALLYLALRTK